MLAKHSLSITVSRFSLFYKFLLYFGIVMAVFAAIAISSMYYIMRPIIEGVQSMQFFEHIAAAAKSMFSGDLALQNAAFATLGADFEVIKQVFATNKDNVVGALIALVVFLFLGKFFITIGHYPAADVLNNFMNSNSKFGFTSNLIAHLKKAVAYSFVETLIYIPFMLLLGVLLYFVFLGVSKLSIIFALSFCILLALVLLGLKRSVFAMWLPTYINEELGVFKSLQKAIIENKHLIIKNWGLFTALNVVAYMFVVLLALVTFGFGALLAYSFITIYYVSVSLVIYYRHNERKYYIDAETVIDSTKMVKSVY